MSANEVVYNNDPHFEPPNLKQTLELKRVSEIYMNSQSLLKPIFIDIPVIIRHIQGIPALPAYLLKIDFLMG